MRRLNQNEIVIRDITPVLSQEEKIIRATEIATALLKRFSGSKKDKDKK